MSVDDVEAGHVQQMERAEEQAQVVAELLADPDARVVRAGVEGGGTAVAVLSDDQALFTATGVADPGEGKEYQLWILRDGVPVGDVVMPDADGRVRAVTGAFAAGDALAMTIEPRGGSDEPTTEPVVMLDATQA
ncbi:anti-sigma factor [Cellulomonas fimi]|uniref:anti-sigma factor n=1 Tax=Cellulomonas fimi TaxID=1708 RepID=UPI0037C18B71